MCTLHNNIYTHIASGYVEDNVKISVQTQQQLNGPPVVGWRPLGCVVRDLSTAMESARWGLQIFVSCQVLRVQCGITFRYLDKLHPSTEGHVNGCSQVLVIMAKVPHTSMCSLCADRSFQLLWLNSEECDGCMVDMGTVFIRFVTVMCLIQQGVC